MLNGMRIHRTVQAGCTNVTDDRPRYEGMGSYRQNRLCWSDFA